MHIKFIAHAGIAVEENGVTILIDPWFTDSSLEQPILEGLTGIRTIDFQIPHTQEKIEAYSPQGILISHFHAHHSPKADILRLIENSFHDIALSYPDGPTNERIEEMVKAYPHVTLHPTKHRDTLTLGSLTVTAFTHTVPGHIAWLVQGKTGSVLHIADGRSHRDPTLSTLDPIWEALVGLRPDIIFMSAGRNSYRAEIDGKRVIGEDGCFSPIQAAQLVQRIQTKAVASIGNQNHSVWKNRNEFIPDTANTEEELRWALAWLVPETKFVQIRPGHTFLVGEEFSKERPIDTYIA